MARSAAQLPADALADPAAARARLRVRVPRPDLPGARRCSARTASRRSRPTSTCCTGDGATFWDVPSLFMWGASDGALTAWAYVGLALVARVLARLREPADRCSRCGSSTAASSASVSCGSRSAGRSRSSRRRCSRRSSRIRGIRGRSRRDRRRSTAIVLMRWLVFRIMLGAGLIKLRGDACWTRPDVPRLALRDPADSESAVAVVSPPAARGARRRRRVQPRRRARRAVVRVRAAPAAARRGRADGRRSRSC